MTSGPQPEEEPASPPVDPAVSLRRLIGYFLWLGTVGFGGPIATVGYMQRDLVERRDWILKRDFLDGVALGQTMPGPLAAQVAMWIGFLRRGACGAAAVAAAFILPSFVIVLGVAVVYRRYAGLAVVQALFYGIAPAVMAIITVAAVKLLRLTNRRDRRLWSISLVLCTVTALTGSELALLVIAAGLLMIALDARPALHRPRWWPPRRPGPDAAGGGRALSLVPAVPAAALGAAITGGMLVSLGVFFVKAGALTFGSGLAIVPFLRGGVVDQYHWLTQAQFLDAVAMGLITPGPVVITATFIGYLAGGLPGALIATVAIFTPIYLGVIVPGPWFIRHRDNRQIKAFVTGATAAASGALAGAVVVLTRQAVIDWPTAAIALGSLALLWRFKISEPYLVVAAGVLGILLH